METDSSPADAARATVRTLIDAGRQVAPELERAILDLGDAAVPSLIELLEDDALSHARGPGEGWAPIHAVALLGELATTAMIEPMLRVLLKTDPLDSVHEEIVRVLPTMGDQVVEPVLRAHADATTEDVRASLADILATCEAHDERIFELLVGRLPVDVVSAAAALADYGDERALPALSDAFDSLPLIDVARLEANEEIRELAGAIEALDGTLTPAQATKIARARELTSRMHRAIMAKLAPKEPARRPATPGRNDPCWCGSQRKYKRCHSGEAPPAADADADA